ncbi:hypothetical protein F2P81_015782 [Scophthalmus maximus]|uniref:Uncharacterized protein n=1 Tax=Scophthalmus maximus TaxID=52904 RepID=A0A6A4SDD1_SCOMX|nr:hypothetical protein F2P81_015782 [Scophthalmus maximus]
MRVALRVFLSLTAPPLDVSDRRRIRSQSRVFQTEVNIHRWMDGRDFDQSTCEFNIGLIFLLAGSEIYVLVWLFGTFMMLFLDATQMCPM